MAKGLDPALMAKVAAERHGVTMDMQSFMEFHLKQVLSGMGIDLKGEQTRDTPARWAKVLLEFSKKEGPVPNIKSFPNDGYDEMVYDRCEFYSYCAHHMMQVTGIIHLAYVPGKTVLGLSKLSRIADYFARQPIMQEDLTKTIADYLETLVGKNVAVKIEGKHFCKCARGISKQKGKMVTTALRGVFRKQAPRAEFLGYCREPDL